MSEGEGNLKFQFPSTNLSPEFSDWIIVNLSLLLCYFIHQPAVRPCSIGPKPSHSVHSILIWCIVSPGTHIILFADDSLLYRNILTPEDSAILQRDLNVLQAWEHENKMEFHPDKCQVLRITNKKKPIQETYP